MVSTELVGYSLKHIAHRKTRSALTILSIFAGITTIFIFVSFGWGLFDYVNTLKNGSGADKVAIIAKGVGAPGLDTTFDLTPKDLRVIQNTPGVYLATGIYAKAAEVQKSKNKKFVFLTGYNPEKPLVKDLSGVKISEGRDLRKGDVSKAVLGNGYTQENKIFSSAIKLNEQIILQGKSIRVIGFFESVGNPQDDSQVYVTDTFFEELYPNSSKKYSWIIAQVDDKNIPTIVHQIESNLRRSRGLDIGKEDFFVSSYEDLLSQYTQALNYIIYFVIFIASISVVVSAVNTANTTITSVLERVREIGVMKAIGAKNSEVFKIFVFESGFLGFIAGSLGTLVGWGVTAIAGNLLKRLGYGFLSPHYSWSLFIGCIFFATLTGALSGVIPAYNASRIQPVTALRYE